ncbi:hypothetical protein [Streptomyces sp. NPDC093223]|uniref:hypothetical protein n=1 Tax=Streptomyces sp. NPDC093223 TaxID=3366033 RepID=UPI003829E03E
MSMDDRPKHLDALLAHVADNLPDEAEAPTPIASPAQTLADQEEQSTARARALLAPIEAKVREAKDRERDKHRTTVLLEAADELDRYVGPQSSSTDPAVEGARLVIRELRRMAGASAVAGVVRYRKRPIEVDTIQWTGDNESAVQAFVGGPSHFYALSPEDREGSDDPEATATVYDKLHSTWVLVYTGQHIVRGVKGEFYPIAEDVLAETYEPVSDPS